MDEVERAAALAVPARARLYEVVAAAYPDWVSREQAAAEADISRSLAAFHLDKLAGAGLLEVTSRRLGDRRGPGGGRPSKLYRRAVAGVELSLPPRRYELAAELLLRAVEAGGAEPVLDEVARRAGAAAASNGLVSTLRSMGYEPVAGEDGAIRLRNCPFHALAERHRTVVCEMNHALLGGLVEQDRARGYAAELTPEPGYCCVVLRRPSSAE